VYVSDDTDRKPVALLARPGTARDRLRDALAQANAMLVLEEDPNQLTVPVLQQAAPEVVLIALEPAVEDAIERLEAWLSAPHLTLIFEEAELAARREGWDQQRWARHLAAKLHGHQNVLPPGSEQDTVWQPGAALAGRPVPNDAADERMLHEAGSVADALPGDSLYAPPAREMLEPVSFEDALAGMVSPGGMPSLPPEPMVPAPVQPPPLPRGAPPPVPAASTPAELPPVVGLGDHSKWALVEEEEAAAPVERVVAPVAEAAPSIATDGLSLVELEPDIDPGSAAPGAILVLAGIGGPDALRRLLGALPQDLTLPVLVYMRLDGGRYGNLVKQMSRVSALPLALAEAGKPVEAGLVHVLPDDVGVEFQHGGLHFIQDASGIQVESLPAEHSAVLMLSGADTARVEAVLAKGREGAWIAGQSGEGCYDPVAATAVVAAGHTAADPLQMAQALSERWGG